MSTSTSGLTPEQRAAADGYAAWPFDRLQREAVRLAEHRRDVAWLWRLFQHTKGMGHLATEGGDLGAVGATVSDTVAALQQVFGRPETTSATPMLREVCAEYLALHGGPLGGAAAGSAPDAD